MSGFNLNFIFNSVLLNSPTDREQTHKIYNKLYFVYQLTHQVYFIAIINLINNIKNSSKIIIYILFFLLSSLNIYADTYNNNSQNLPQNLASNLTEKILEAEFIAQTGNKIKSLELYSEIAKSTLDIQIAKRATEIALELNNNKLALQNAKIWATKDISSAKAQVIALLLSLQNIDINNKPDSINLNNFLTILLTNLIENNKSDTYSYIELLLNSGLNQQQLNILGINLNNILNYEGPNLRTNINNIKNKFNLYFALSLYNEKINNPKQSIIYINKTLSEKPDLYPAQLQKVKLLNTYKSTKGALAYLENTVATYPKQDELRKIYADILFDLEDWGQASTQYIQLAKTEVYKEDALLQLAFIKFTNNDLKTAKKYLLKLTDSEKYSDLAFYYLGLIYKQTNNLDHALKYFNSINIHQNNQYNKEYFIRSQLHIFNILLKQKKYTQANKTIENIYNSSENNTENNTKSNSAHNIYLKEVILSEAQLLFEQQQYDEALAILTNLEQVYPKDPDILYSIGILSKTINNDKIFLQNMSLILENHPDDAKVLSALGWHYYKQNDFEKSYDYLQKAYDNDQFNSAQISTRLGAVLWKLDKQDQANKMWDNVLKLDPNNQELADIIEKYKN